ncbi:hypothetical protein [Paraburkholderia caribensis]|uniref:hypothetical protein n=1 Tax=Paraburkholderia caribensis TaxID=75105 RepID=UPI0020911583|nr:hypothetical protein [Paraburkholderia caribensis]MCO4880228.1 hypothetical protein [Paraburkholderia caribensis]
MSTTFALVRKDSFFVENMILWDGKTEIVGIEDEYLIVANGDCSIGWTYDPASSTFVAPGDSPPVVDPSGNIVLTFNTPATADTIQESTPNESQPDDAPDDSEQVGGV